MSSSFHSVFTMISSAILLLIIIVEHTRSDHFHPSHKDDVDPIDPTGRGSPGIVIVYNKKSDEPPRDSPPNNYYLPQGNRYDDDYHHHHSRPPPSQHYGPYNQQHYKHNSGFKPTCASGGDFYCLYDRDYPMDKVKTVVQHYIPRLSTLYEDLNHYTTQDYISHDNNTHNYRHKGNFICESDVSYVRPGWAKNWKGEWVTVLNTDVYPQSVRIETCKYPKKKCEYMPPCYHSYCVQRYTYVKLICLDPYNPDKKPTVDVFEIPSACSCFVEHFPLYK